MDSTASWPTFFFNGFLCYDVGSIVQVLESCDYENNPLDVHFVGWNVVDFSSPFAARSVCSKKSFYIAYEICILLRRSVLDMMFIERFCKSVFWLRLF